MNNFNFTLLLVTLSILAACGSKGGGEGAGSIPNDLSFDEKTLPPISDTDFLQSKLVARTAGDAAEPQSQVLIKKDETANDQRRREDKFNKMRPDIQRLVRTWQADCKPNHLKNGKGIEGTPQAGKSYISIETNESTGARCPLKMAERFETTISVTQFTQTPLNFGMNFTATGTSRSEYTDPAQQQIVGAAAYDMTFTASGRNERAGENNLSYMRMSGGGNIETLNFGTVHLEATMENLERPGTEKTLNVYRISQGGKTFVFTQVVSAANKIMPVPRFFIGNRELTPEEVLSMGEFPFNTDENKTGLRHP